MATWILLFLLSWMWVFGAGVTAYVAGKRGRNGADWLLLSLAVSPFIAFPALIALPPRS